MAHDGYCVACRQGKIQVYDQSEPEDPSAPSSVDTGLWDWSRCNDKNLFEVPEFRTHMPLHNFYEGYASSKDGLIAGDTLEAVEDRMRGVLEECDQLRMIQCLVDMNSAWGGFAHEVLTYVSEECRSAVVVTLGNDWAYPLANQSLESVYSAAPAVRDRAKMSARTSINMASSLALLSDVSSLLVPLAMTPLSLASSRFSHLQFDRSSCAEVSSIVAASIALALSANENQSAYEMLEGVVPSMKLMDLAAYFPCAQDPTLLIRRSQRDDSIFKPYSLLPSLAMPVKSRHAMEDEDADEDRADVVKTYYRRVHVRGRFANCAVVDADACSDNDCSVVRTLKSLVVPQDYRLRHANTEPLSSPVDGVSQLTRSGHMGRYLSSIAAHASQADRRILYEFARSGMNPDAVEELQTTLDGFSDSYKQ